MIEEFCVGSSWVAEYNEGRWFAFTVLEELPGKRWALIFCNEDGASGEIRWFSFYDTFNGPFMELCRRIG